MSSTRFRLALGALLLIALGISAGFFVAAHLKVPTVPPASSSETVVRPLPNVLVSVRDLARLESVSFHMERVLDLTEKQSRLFGLIESEDAILLVAVADVGAGVDLGKVEPGDIDAAADGSRVTIRLPKPEVFHVTLDNQHTYVHTRRTDLLARRQETLESKARAEAEKALLEGAQQAGILRQAGDNARRIIEELVRSLGYRAVDVSYRDP